MTTEKPATTQATPTTPQMANPVQRTEVTPEMLASKNYPRTAFYLASFAGILMFIAGLFAIFFNALYLAIVWSIWAGLTSFLIGIGLIICSLFVSGGAASLVMRPATHRAAGATIIIFSLLALLMGFGWIWLFGSGLGIIGGLLAIFWRPRTVPA